MIRTESATYSGELEAVPDDIHEDAPDAPFLRGH